MQIYSEPSARMPDPNPQRHILVVEDDAFVRDVVEIYLREEGYRVTTATNGQEMRNVLAGDPADLVLMDLRLPGEDGFMLTRYLREHHDCGIIILTTRTETADRVAGLECGADDYVVKPFAERELLARIRSVMRRAPTHRPVPRAQTARDESAVSFHGYVLSAAAGIFVTVVS